MGIDPQTINGVPAPGTPLGRLAAALNVPDTARFVEVLAGDLLDVCDTLGAKAKPEIKQKAAATADRWLGEPVKLKPAEVKELVSAAVGG